MRAFLVSVLGLLLAGTVLAVTPATELYLPSVAHSTNTGGNMWRTDAWVYNPGTQSAQVTIYFLERQSSNPAPLSYGPFAVAAGETKEFPDIILETFNRDGKNGALRFVADQEIVVTGRIYDANVQGKTMTGSAGQFFGGLPASMAIGNGEATDIIGLAQDNDNPQHWRSNFGIVEVTGNAATVKVDQLDGTGTPVASKTYSTQIKGYGAMQVAMTDIGSKLGSNQRLHISVTGGTGKVLAFGSRIDSYTGDPSTVEMTGTAAAAVHTTGRFDGTVSVTDTGAERIDGGVRLAFTSSTLTDYEGVGGILCDSIPYTLDFSPDAGLAATITNDSFTAPAVAIAYEDTPGHTIFTTTWTLTGTRSSDGTWSGSLTSSTSGGSGSWAGCNGTVQHTWRAAWTGNS
jgi:hypothetical protein